MKVAKVEASLDVKEMLSDDPLPELPMTSPQSAPLVGVACRDASQKIIGGGSAYPDLVPAKGTVLVEAHLITSGDPASCTASVGAPVVWKAESAPASGSATPAPASTAPAAAGTAETAFRTWVDQFNAHDWHGHYAFLVNAQKAAITEAQYTACRQKDGATPTLTYEKLLSSKPVSAYPIPGTTAKLNGTQLTVQVKLLGTSTSLDAHMFQEDGICKWTMTEQNMSKCKG